MLLAPPYQHLTNNLNTSSSLKWPHIVKVPQSVGLLKPQKAFDHKYTCGGEVQALLRWFRLITYSTEAIINFTQTMNLNEF